MLNWKDVAATVGKFAPMAGTLLGGPAGAAIGAMLAAALGTEPTPDAIRTAIATDPQAALKLAQFQSDNDLKLKAMVFAHADNVLAADLAAMQTVNATIQIEAKADHWMTYSWRPMLGFCVGFNTVAAAILTLMVYGGVMLGIAQAVAALPTLPLVLGALAAISGTVLPILGIASYFRGKGQADPALATDMRG